MENRRSLTQEHLKSLLHYDPATGIFTWVTKRKVNAVKAGQRAGAVNTKAGYRSIQIDKQRYYEHILAFLYMTGKWPEFNVDHKNLNSGDNRWTNLREATRRQNIANRAIFKKNKSGFKGVDLHHGKRWRAAIKYKDQNIHLGYFATKEEAAEAYRLKALELHGEFARV